MCTNAYIQKGSNEETVIENRLMDMGRGEKRVRCMERVTWKLTFHMSNRYLTGGNEVYGESNMETYITLCKMIVNGHLLYVSGNSNTVFVSA